VITAQAAGGKIASSWFDPAIPFLESPRRRAFEAALEGLQAAV
jgi:hypothetical protein